MKNRKANVFSIIKDWSEGKISLPKISRRGTAKITGNTSRISKPSLLTVKQKRSGGIGNGHKNTSINLSHNTGIEGVSTLKHISSGGSKVKSGSGGGTSISSPFTVSGGSGKRGFGFAGPKVIIKVNYIRGARRVRSHLKYIEHRQQDERGELFSKEGEDNLNRSWFLDRFKETDNVFRIVISPADKDVDLKDMVREVMERFERRKDKEMLWIASIHKDPEHTSHPHVHMALSAATDNNHRIRIERHDIEFLKKEASEYISREKNLFNSMEAFLNIKPKKQDEKEKEIDIGL